MYRTSLRSSAQIARALRQPVRQSLREPLRQPLLTLGPATRRFASTAAAGSGKGTWKGTAARWGLAIGALYWYNTSPIFADEATRQAILATPDDGSKAATGPQDAELRTIDALLEEKQKLEVEKAKAAAATASKTADATSTTPPPPGEDVVAATAAGALGGESPEALEEEASQQGAFNPETGEINWDCPCLGGMAHGPCGEDFKAAFSCFVFSAEEPKGMDCIDKFQHMQDCFRQYPEIYGAELADNEQDDEAGPQESQQQPPIPVEGVPEGVAASEATPVTESSETPAAAEPAEVKTVIVASVTPESTPKESMPAATPAATLAPAEAAPAVPAAPAAPVEEVRQADPGPVEAEPKKEDPFDDRFMPKAAFDATEANKSK